jgi:hypothetical protein
MTNRILLVDDDEAVAFMLFSSFSTGYTLHEGYWTFGYKA